MKKRFFMVVLLVVTACFPLLFSGCEMLKPYIKVVDLKTEYMVGDELDVSGAKIHYYEDEGMEDFSEFILKEYMISGFSTQTAGTFTMTITYNRLTTKVEYTVEEKPTGDDNNQTILLTEIEANELLEEALNTMCLFAQIKETISIPFLGQNITTYRITTETKSYEYYDENEQAWIEKDGDDWFYYEIVYDIGEEELVYTKYALEIEFNDVRKYVYDISIIEGYDFVEGEKVGNEYLLTFVNSEDDTDFIDIKITGTTIKSIEWYYADGEQTEVLITSTLTYYSSETSEIPSKPTVEWEDGGEYDIEA